MTRGATIALCIGAFLCALALGRPSTAATTLLALVPAGIAVAARRFPNNALLRLLCTDVAGSVDVPKSVHAWRLSLFWLSSALCAAATAAVLLRWHGDPLRALGRGEPFGLLDGILVVSPLLSIVFFAASAWQLLRHLWLKLRGR